MGELKRRLQRLEHAARTARLEEQHRTDEKSVRFLREDSEARAVVHELERLVASYSGPPPPSDYAPTTPAEERFWVWAIRHDSKALEVYSDLLSRWSDYLWQVRAAGGELRSSTSSSG